MGSDWSPGPVLAGLVRVALTFLPASHGVELVNASALFLLLLLNLVLIARQDRLKRREVEWRLRGIIDQIQGETQGQAKALCDGQRRDSPEPAQRRWQDRESRGRCGCQAVARAGRQANSSPVGLQAFPSVSSRQKSRHSSRPILSAPSSMKPPLIAPALCSCSSGLSLTLSARVFALFTVICSCVSLPPLGGGCVLIFDLCTGLSTPSAMVVKCI